CRMTDPQGGKIYGVHVIEVNRSLPLGAVLDDVVDRGEKILDEVEKLAAAAQLQVETELVQARDTGPALVDEAVEWGADLIVMGLPYKRRFGEFNLGKTVPYVLKNANCRVMLFREQRAKRLQPVDGRGLEADRARVRVVATDRRNLADLEPERRRLNQNLSVENEVVAVLKKRNRLEEAARVGTVARVIFGEFKPEHP